MASAAVALPSQHTQSLLGEIYDTPNPYTAGSNELDNPSVAPVIPHSQHTQDLLGDSINTFDPSVAAAGLPTETSNPPAAANPPIDIANPLAAADLLIDFPNSAAAADPPIGISNPATASDSPADVPVRSGLNPTVEDAPDIDMDDDNNAIPDIQQSTHKIDDENDDDDYAYVYDEEAEGDYMYKTPTYRKNNKGVDVIVRDADGKIIYRDMTEEEQKAKDELMRVEAEKRATLLGAGAANAMEKDELVPQVRAIWKLAFPIIRKRFNSDYNEPEAIAALEKLDKDFVAMSRNYPSSNGRGQFDMHSVQWKAYHIHIDSMKKMLDSLSEVDLDFNKQGKITKQQWTTAEALLNEADQLRISVERRGIPFSLLLSESAKFRIAAFSTLAPFWKKYESIWMALLKVTDMQKEVLNSWQPIFRDVLTKKSLDEKVKSAEILKQSIAKFSTELATVNREWDLPGEDKNIEVAVLEQYINEYATFQQEEEQALCTKRYAALVKAQMYTMGLTDWVPEVDSQPDHQTMVKFFETRLKPLIKIGEKPTVRLPPRRSLFGSNGPSSGKPQPKSSNTGGFGGSGATSNTGGFGGFGAASTRPGPGGSGPGFSARPNTTTTLPSSNRTSGFKQTRNHTAGRNIDPELSSLDDVGPLDISLPKVNGLWTQFGNVVNVSRMGRGTYRIVVNCGTEERPLMKGITSSNFGRGDAEDLFAIAGTETIENVRQFRARDIQGLCWLAEWPYGKRQIRKWGVEWMPGVQGPPVISHSQFISIAGKKQADQRLAEMKAKVKKRTMLFEKCRERGIHPDTKEKLTVKDQEECPWLHKDGFKANQSAEGVNTDHIRMGFGNEPDDDEEL